MNRIFPILLALLLLAGCAAPAEEPTPEQQEEYLCVHFIDVGQADCTLLKLGDCDILIDGGNTADSTAVVNYLNAVGVDDLELVISTHAHEDHCGGLSAVLRNFAAEAVWATVTDFSTGAYTSFVSQVAKNALELYIPSVGDTYVYEDLTLTVLGPVADYESTNTNNTSIVVMVQYGDRKFLLTGDMESDAEADLLATGADLSADVLKVGHHGSYTSSSNDFLAAVSARYAVIHVGAGNEYGHPHESSMNRLRAADLDIYRTDLMGTVVIATDGEELVFLWTNRSGRPEINSGAAYDNAA